MGSCGCNGGEGVGYGGGVADAQPIFTVGSAGVPVMGGSPSVPGAFLSVAQGVDVENLELPPEIRQRLTELNIQTNGAVAHAMSPGEHLYSGAPKGVGCCDSRRADAEVRAEQAVADMLLDQVGGPRHLDQASGRASHVVGGPETGPRIEYRTPTPGMHAHGATMDGSTGLLAYQSPRMFMNVGSGKHPGPMGEWVYQDLEIFRLGWTHPRCSGQPDTWDYKNIKEAFRIGPDGNMDTRSGMGQVINDAPLRVDSSSGAPTLVRNTRRRVGGPDMWSSRVNLVRCKLCIYWELRIGVWWPACKPDPSRLPSRQQFVAVDRNVGFILVQATYRGKGCLFQPRGMGAGDRNKALRFKCSGRKQLTALRVYYNICPCKVGRRGWPEPEDPPPPPVPPRPGDGTPRTGRRRRIAVITTPHGRNIGEELHPYKPRLPENPAGVGLPDFRMPDLGADQPEGTGGDTPFPPGIELPEGPKDPGGARPLRPGGAVPGGGRPEGAPFPNPAKPAKDD